MIPDKSYGVIMLASLASFFSYFTFWIIVTPFIDADHFLQEYFPKREYGIMGAVAFGIFFLSAIGIFASMILIRNPDNFAPAIKITEPVVPSPTSSDFKED